jgi:hypothetical protein
MLIPIAVLFLALPTLANSTDVYRAVCMRDGQRAEFTGRTLPTTQGDACEFRHGGINGNQHKFWALCEVTRIWEI